MSDRHITVYDLGTTGYHEVHRLQQRLQDLHRRGKGEDTLLLTEHRPVFTLGRGHAEPSLRVPVEVVSSAGIDIVQTERGGDITYHGPGQVVGYPILNLKEWGLHVADYVAGLEETIIHVLADWGIRGSREDGKRGVWVDNRKIASVGINVRSWVTMHGVAVNVAPNMRHFDLINPCGLEGAQVTSLAAEVHTPVDIAEVADSFVFHFEQVFDCEATLADLASKARHA